MLIDTSLKFPYDITAAAHAPFAALAVPDRPLPTLCANPERAFAELARHPLPLSAREENGLRALCIAVIDRATPAQLMSMPVQALHRDIQAYGHFSGRLAAAQRAAWMGRQVGDCKDRHSAAATADLMSLALESAVIADDADTLRVPLEQLQRPAYRRVDAASALDAASRVAQACRPGEAVRAVWHAHCAGLLEQGRLSRTEHRRLTAMLESPL